MRGRLIVLVVCLAAAVQSFGATTGVVIDNDGKAIAGARVSAYAPELGDAMRARQLSANPEPVPIATTTTDTKGKFSFDKITDPVVSVTVIAPGFAPAATRVEKNEDTGTITLTKAPSRQGRITAGGKPVAGATVNWIGDTEVVAKTDDQGRYNIPDPSKWAFQVIVHHPDFPLLTELARKSPMAAVVDADRALPAAVAIRGRVVGEDGTTPVPNAAISVDGWPSGTAGADGTFSIAQAPSKWTSVLASTTPLRAMRLRGTGAGEVTLRLAKPATISGTVRDTKGQLPVAGAEIRLRSTSRPDFFNPAIAITDAKGAFTASGILPGSYDFVVIHPSYSFSPTSISVAAGDKLSRSLLMTQLARVSGSVIDEEKKPIAGVKVQTSTVSREASFAMFMPATRLMTTAPDGTFVLRADPDGDIQVLAVRKGYPQARSTTMRLAPGERKSGVVVTIPSGLVVTGRVIDRDGKPVSGVAVSATETSPQSGGMMQRMIFTRGRTRDDDYIQTAADGTFNVRVKEGSYDFLFKRDGYAAKVVRAQQVSRNTKPLEITIEPGVEITGRVTRGGAGVEGVNVNVFGETSGMATAETGFDGSFRLTDLTPGSMMLSARKQDDFIQINRPVTAPATDLLLEVPPGGRITGRVLDKNTKQPVTAFQAGISTPRGGGMMMIVGPQQSRSFTSDDGTFTLDNVPAGTLVVNVQAPGYTAGRVTGVTVEEGKTAADIEVLMDRGARVTGRVTGPDGAPLSGVTVRVETGGRREMPNPGRAGTTTDASGEYSIEAVEPGEKTFAFARSGYIPTQKAVTVSGSDAKVDAQLSTGVRVTGTVVTEAGAPVTEASVVANSAVSNDFGSRSTQTDANGAFSFESLEPGRYTFYSQKNGIGSANLRDVDVSTGAPVRIIVKTGGTIYGRVTGLTAQELQQASVFASGSGGGGGQAAVDANGNYRIEGAPAGTVRLSARTGQGFSGGKTSAAISVQVEPGSQVQQDIEFKTSTVVRGRVTKDGRPLPDAMVAFFPKPAQAQTTARTTTDRDGYYEVNGLDDATYTVSVADIQRNIPYSTTYDVRGSGTFNVDMKSGSLRGRVIDGSTGAGVAEAVVEVREAQEGMGFAMRGGQTDASGAFVIEGVTSGKYYVSAAKEGYGTKVVDMTMTDSAADVELKLTRNAGVTMRVVDARDGRLLNARVRVVDGQGRVVTDNMRFFGGGGGADEVKLTLEPGTYRATIWAQNYATQQVQITSPSTPTIGMTPGGSIAIRSRGSALRRARLMTPDGREYARGMGASGLFTVDASPGVTTLDNVAPGVYTLQILGSGDNVEKAAQINVLEGQRADVDI